MESLAALSLAATIVQLIDFSSKVFRESKEILKSGQAVNVAELTTIATDLTTLRSSVETQLTKAVPAGMSLTVEEQAVIDLARGCEEVAQALLDRLEKLSRPPSNKHKLWRSITKAVKTGWSSEHINELTERLSNYRQQLSLRILVLLNSQQRAQTTALSHIDDGQKQIVDVVTVHAETQQKRFAKEELRAEQRHIEVMTAILTMQDGSCRTIANTASSNTRWGYVPSELSKSNNVTHFHGLATDHSSVEGVWHGHSLQVEFEPVNLRQVTDTVINALHYREINSRHASVVQAHHQTYEWVLDPSKSPKKGWSSFPDWLRAGEGCYWINGKAGSGKSTLMKYINNSRLLTKHLREWAGRKTLVVGAFFFWYAGTPLEKTQAGLLRALLYRFLQSQPNYATVLFPDLCRSCITRQRSSHFELSLSELRSAFTNLIQSKSQHVKVCFLIDGIDEYVGDHHELGELLSQAAASGWIKIVLSSRPIPSCVQMFSDFPGLRLQDLTTDDIRKFAQDKLKAHPLMEKVDAETNGTTSKLVDEIVHKAWGVFLWVALVVKLLIRGLEDYDTASDLLRRLDELPDDLQKLYNHMLESMSMANRKEGAKLLLLVLRSSEIQGSYPMTLIQLSFAMDVWQPVNGKLDQRSNLLPDMKADTEEWRCQRTEGRLRSRCCGLVEVLDPQYPPHGRPGRVVQFLHRTVVEFLHHDENLARLDALTSVEQPDVVEVLLRSSVAEMRAKRFERSSQRQSSLGYKALLRFFSYASNNGDALSLCLDTYILLVKEVMIETWKDGDGTWAPCLSNALFQQIVHFAARTCPPALFEPFIRTISLSEGNESEKTSPEFLKALFAARLFVVWISRTVDSGKLVDNIIACHCNPNLRVLPLFFATCLDNYFRRDEKIPLDRLTESTPGYSLWEFVLEFVNHQVKDGREHWRMMDGMKLLTLMKLIVALLNDDARVQDPVEITPERQFLSPLQTMQALSRIVHESHGIRADRALWPGVARTRAWNVRSFELDLMQEAVATVMEQMQQRLGHTASAAHS